MKNISQKVNVFIQQLFKNNPKIELIVEDIAKNNGKAVLVGGAVRDLFLSNQLSKDIDIEVYGLTLDQLSKILSNYGYVDFVGKSFGVLRIKGLDIDWSLPRKDSKGRKPQVEIDPFLSFEKAFKRRDLTINSLGIDLNSGELIDIYGGLKDLENKVLRATDPNFFVQDPLRLFRVMQFISRFEMEPDKKLNEICKKMDISNVSKERIESEFNKLLLKSKKPSLGIRWLKKIGRLKEVLPELYATIGVEQNPQWHPEGDVFEHSMQTLDEAAKIECDTQQEKLILMWAALCHDLGKVTTSKVIDGKIKSIGHDVEGAPIAKKMLKRITDNQEILKVVPKLVYYHMRPLMLMHSNAKGPAYKRLANKLHPISIEFLSKLVKSDRLGRKAPDGSVDHINDLSDFIQKTKKLNVFKNREEPVLQGKDLLEFFEPGPKIGKILEKAYKIQIEKGIKSKTDLLKRVIKNGKNKILFAFLLFKYFF